MLRQGLMHPLSHQPLGTGNSKSSHTGGDKQFVATQVSLHGGETYAYPLYSTQCVVTTDDAIKPVTCAGPGCHVSQVWNLLSDSLEPAFPFFGLMYVSLPTVTSRL